MALSSHSIIGFASKFKKKKVLITGTTCFWIDSNYFCFYPSYHIYYYPRKVVSSLSTSMEYEKQMFNVIVTGLPTYFAVSLLYCKSKYKTHFRELAQFYRTVILAE